MGCYYSSMSRKIFYFTIEVKSLIFAKLSMLKICVFIIDELENYMCKWLLTFIIHNVIFPPAASIMYLSIRVSIYIYAYAYIYMCVCVCVYIYIFILTLGC